MYELKTIALFILIQYAAKCSKNDCYMCSCQPSGCVEWCYSNKTTCYGEFKYIDQVKGRCSRDTYSVLRSPNTTKQDVNNICFINPSCSEDIRPALSMFPSSRNGCLENSQIKFEKPKIDLAYDSYLDRVILTLYSPEFYFVSTEKNTFTKIEDYIDCNYFVPYSHDYEEVPNEFGLFNKIAYESPNQREDYIIFDTFKYPLFAPHGSFYVTCGICEKYCIESDILRTNITNFNTYGNEYVAVIQTITPNCSIDQCDIYLFDYATNDEFIIDGSRNRRIMRVENYDIDSFLVTVYIDFDTPKSVDIFNRSRAEGTTVISLRSAFYCPEVVEKNLTWPKTPINQVTFPTNACLDKHNSPVYRQCLDDYASGAMWSEVHGECDTTDLPESTSRLKELSEMPMPSTQLLNDLIEAINSNASILDIYYISKIMEKAVVAASIEETSRFIEEIQKINGNVLRKAQVEHRSIDNILQSLDKILTNQTENMQETNTLYVKQKTNLVHIFNSDELNITGVVIFENMSVTHLHNFEKMDSSYLLSDVLLAIYFPEVLLLDIKKFTGNIGLILFRKNNLFPGSKPPHGAIINLVIPGSRIFLQDPISVYFARQRLFHIPTCAYWQYAKDNLDTSDWSTKGSYYEGDLNKLTICNYSHLTSFSLLVEVKDFGLTEGISKTFDIATLIGTSLSVFGVVVIYLTAAISREWRSKAGTMILLNLSMTLLLESIFIQIVDVKVLKLSNTNTAKIVCRFVSAVLHFAIFSKFGWMLIAAYFQYQRFVKVLKTVPDHLVLKASIFSWGMPIIPVLIVAYMNNDKHSIACYPDGVWLLGGIIVPIFMIISINTFIFVKILYTVRKNRKSRTELLTKPNANGILLEAELGFFLCFMFGMPWWFGVVANLLNNRYLLEVVLLLFCTTASVQGFVFFVFFVVLNRDTRLAWKNIFAKSRKYNVN